ncbi:MAG: DUF3570 domain-containing protein [Gammaproteobacteria bacterium]|nr:DUF3570 domain-containing protein [Gammaproteobacteria bacterium]
MAATKTKFIAGNLAVATCALLSQQVRASAVENDWVLDTSYLSYTESDNRVAVDKLIIKVDGAISERDSVALGFIFDTMSGATPTGAVQATNLVSVSGASGAGGLGAGGAALSLAPFEDTRLGVDFTWSHANNRFWRTKYGAAVSVENDYTSLTGSINQEMETEDKLRMVAYGISLSQDAISRTGGDTPGPLTNIDDGTVYGEGERNTVDMFTGVTQVINARMLARFNLSYTLSAGYHSDPYKVVSVANEDDIELERYYESRPDRRRRSSFFSELVYQTKKGSDLHVSHRYYNDDWGIESQTLEYTQYFHFKGNNGVIFANDWYLAPSVRYYTQTKADFFYRSIPVFSELPDYASADGRLDDMQTYSAGVQYSRPAGRGGEFRARVLNVYQTFEDSTFDQLSSLTFQVSYKVSFY